MIYKGSCHCNRVQFQIETDDLFQDLYRCNCSLCKKKSIVMKAVHRDHFFLIRGRDYLGSYKWNKNIAEHFFCRFCGVYTHHKRRRYPEQMVSNFACLDGMELPPAEEIATVDGASHD